MTPSESVPDKGLVPDKGPSLLLREALRTVASTLKAEQIGFALAGGYGLWVHGAPEPVHDVDVAVADRDVEAAAVALAQAGLRVERPPEDWLFKAYAGDAMVDVLHRLRGEPVDERLLATAPEHEVLGLRIPVLPATEIVLAKLEALSERNCDLEGLLAVVRAVREQLDWETLGAAADGRPFVEAFLVLVARLGIAPDESFSKICHTDLPPAR